MEEPVKKWKITYGNLETEDYEGTFNEAYDHAMVKSKEFEILPADE